MLLIGIACYFLLYKKDVIEVNTEDFKDFAIEDTASIDQVYLSQPNGKQVLITRRDNGTWMVNNQFPARKDAINLILKTLHDVQVKGNVAKESFDHVVKRLATGSTKVEFYAGGKKPEKIWYIGDATVSRLGTYMLLEKDGKKSSKPYITHMLMERGYLSTRFFLDPTLWKDRVMMRCNPKEIKSLQVKHLNDADTSFRIEQVSLGQFTVTNLRTQETESLDATIAVPFLKEYAGVFYEYVDRKTPKEVLDSIYGSLPRHSIEIMMNDGNKIVMKTYNMPVLPGAELEGKPIDYHPERMYAYTSYLGDDVHPIVQNFIFDQLVPSLGELKSLTTVEK